MQAQTLGSLHPPSGWGSFPFFPPGLESQALGENCSQIPTFGAVGSGGRRGSQNTNIGCLAAWLLGQDTAVLWRPSY